MRYSMYDKYFKQISANCSQVGSVACPAGTSKANEATYLLSWYYAFGGSTTGAWSWRISGTEIHEGHQNPLAAFALSNTSSLIPLSPSAKSDWATSLTTQLNLMQWLQSGEGAIAGGATNNWGGNYGDAGKPPAGDPTFDGMYYDFEPVYHNPPSNQWFGYQAWPMERVAEYYYVTGNAQAKAILQKWVSWASRSSRSTRPPGRSASPASSTGAASPPRASRPAPRPRQHPDDLRRQHLPVHPALVHQRGELPRGAELPERRGSPGVQLPPVLGRGGHRDGARLVRLPVPHRVPAGQRHPHGHGHQPGHPGRHRRHRADPAGPGV
ncbi:MAG TPA: glycoside hydrolase family 48 protein [Trebonia sp.]